MIAQMADGLLLLLQNTKRQQSKLLRLLYVLIYAIVEMVWDIIRAAIHGSIGF